MRHFGSLLIFQVPYFHYFGFIYAKLSHICSHWFWFTLLANFDFYIRLRINFHTSSFWVLILAAGGPYWVLISQKKMGPYLKAWGSLLVLEAVHQGQKHYRTLFLHFPHEKATSSGQKWFLRPCFLLIRSMFSQLKYIQV